MNISLSELCYKIANSLQADFAEPVWVHAEISELSVRNGHCYMELIEKKEGNNTFTAKIRATCWANVFGLLKPYFEEQTSQTLRTGLQVLLSVTVEFHSVFGLNLNIHDIDPTYTVGNMACQRLEVIARLQAEGIMEMNKQIPFPILPQRLAIISAASAAGYGDFCHQLDNNPSHFVFYKKLFPAIVQGEHAESSIISALEKIYAEYTLFDAVVIIRGGGATTDLSCFDSYELALNCAQFPLPIITGIGHQRDVSVLDLIAHTSVKTPTAAAEFLLNTLLVQEQKIMRTCQQLQKISFNTIAYCQSQLDQLKNAIKSNITYRLSEQQNRLIFFTKTIKLYSPERILKQGYTLTLKNGDPVTSATQLHQGDKITTHFVDGKISSTIL